MHRDNRRAVQVWYRLIAGMPAKLKHTGVDLHNERTFRHIVMHFCNFSASAGMSLTGAFTDRCDITRAVHAMAGV